MYSACMVSSRPPISPATASPLSPLPISLAYGRWRSFLVVYIGHPGENGGDAMSRRADVPTEFVSVLEGLMLLFFALVVWFEGRGAAA